MWILVTYDVSTETKEGQRRMRRVAVVCQDYGQRVQKSVFECWVGPVQYERLKRRLLRVINPEEDSLRIYRLTEPREKYVEEFGLSRYVDFQGPLVL